jgi:hypothetical protein
MDTGTGGVQKRYIGEYYRIVEAQSENKTEEKRLGTDQLTRSI